MKKRDSNRLILTASVITLVSMSCSLTSASENANSIEIPPFPNFNAPIDYVDWYREHTPSQNTKSGDKLYAALGDYEKPGEKVQKQLKAAMRGPWTADDYPELAAFIKSSRNKMNAFIAAAAQPRFQWELNPDKKKGLIFGVLFAGGSSRRYSSLVLADSWCVSNGRKPEAQVLLKAWETCLNNANHMESGFGFVPLLVAASIRQNVYIAINAGLEAGVFDKRSSRDARDLLLDKTESLRLGEACRYELMAIFDILQRLFPGGKYSSEFSGTQMLPPDINTISPEETASIAENYYRRSIECAGLEPSLDTYEKVKSITEQFKAQTEKNALLKTMLSSTDRIYLLCQKDETMRRGTILAVSIYRHEQRKGSWPESLEDLGRSKIAFAKNDPYSKNGEEFIYKLKNGKPVLYSRGFDGRDNGAKAHEKAYSEKGYDIVILPHTK